MTRVSKWSAVLGLSLAVACGGDDGDGGSSEMSGGVEGSGGGAASSGGTTETGGSETGGDTSTGGTAASGGDMGSGGAVTGGDAGTGGSQPEPTGCRALPPAENPGNPCYDAPPPALQFTEVVTGLNEPTFMTSAPGDATRLFVLERGGLIRVVKDGTLLATPLIDLSAKLTIAGRAGERGLLGMAFDPDYENNKRFWVNYSGAESVGGTVVESYRINPDGDTADPDSGQVLLEIPQPAENHNGGMLAFGPDDCLYIAMGDGGGSNDTYGNGQDPNSYLGGLLRVDVDNYQESVGAPGNVLGNPHKWSYGLRNPWRFSFDSEKGDLYIGDVGQGAWEEVDVEPRGVAGRNYGWPCYEGLELGPKTMDCQGPFTDPVAVHGHDEGGARNLSVIGGYVYRGSAIPAMAGRYVYADYNSRRLWTFTWKADGEICDQYELTADANNDLDTGGSISSFGQDASGELYVLVYDSGRILRIDAK